MFVIDNSSKTPIYEQIKTQILALVSSGVLKPGDKLPSLRSLSSSMSLNINTIKKVFSELENDGVIISVLGSGSYVSDNAVRNPKILEKAENELTEALRSAKSVGVTKEEVLSLVEKIYEEEIR
ncbi:MAG: GntR family transcriptional regulator [Clostridia bacterium]|nr:GntR family transcriptional regulator [Clostridia bacterium]MBR6754999.1 GntR family transcriptional regulator [Clostridia bacterium]